MTSTAGTSTSTVLTSLTTNAIVFACFLFGFLVLRYKFKRIYRPKSSFDLVPEEKKPEDLPPGIFKWLYVLLRIKHEFILKQAGIDGYFFVRYLIVIASFMGIGCFMLIILLPVNATGGNGESGFDLLAISNISNPNRYYCHVLMAWIFYGMFLFVLFRELTFYNSMRVAVQSCPAYAKKLSSRTVLFQSVSDQFLDEEEFAKLFEGVVKVWVARGQRKLAQKVKKRNQVAFRLEGSLHKLLKKAVKAKLKAEKKGQLIEPSDEISAYVPTNKRPRHKLKPLFGKKVDTIEWCKEQLPILDEEIKELQANYDKVKPMNSIFVEFENQYYAQLAYQSTPSHIPLHFGPKYIGIAPEDILWPNMRLFWWERLVRSNAAIAAICGCVILWAFPVAFVGVISNLTYLTNKLTFLKFIYKLPTQLLGLITSLLPTVMLLVLMALLPRFLRAMAKVAGAPSVQQVEYMTQNSYLAFLVIQVFLVTTISSSATSVVTEIIQKPTSAMTLLASNLPKSSNFYISYLILQGLSISGGALFQITSLLLFYAFGFLLDKTVRKKQARFANLSTYSWGTVFPVYTNLTIITLAYAIISPLIIPFATGGFALLYIAYLHNICYVFGESPDFKGAYYPRALFQTMVGIYLGEVCLLGLFVVGKGWGPIVLEIILIIFTVFVHLNMKTAYEQLLKAIPADSMRPLDGKSITSSYGQKVELVKTNKKTNNFDMHKKKESESPFMSRAELNELSSTEKSQSQAPATSPEETEAEEQARKDAVAARVAYAREQEEPLLIDGDDYGDPDRVPNFLIRFFQPHIYLSFKAAKEMLPDSYFEEPEPMDPEEEEHAYDYPDVTATAPVLWIPRDPMGLSQIEMEKLKGIIYISDENAIIDKKGKVQWLRGEPPTYEEAVAKNSSQIEDSSIVFTDDEEE